MKTSRYSLLSSLVWVLFCVLAVACSKKDNNSATNCPAGYSCVNGGVIPVGAGSGIPYLSSPNGGIQNSGRFDDFDLRIFPQYSSYHCQYIYSPYGYDSCNDIQVGVAVNGTSYGIALVTGRLANTQVGSGVPGSVVLQAQILSQNSTATVYGVYETNPTPYLIMSLVVSGTAADTSRNYSMTYYTNAQSYTIATGTMRKGVDYQ